MTRKRNGCSSRRFENGSLEAIDLVKGEPVKSIGGPQGASGHRVRPFHRAGGGGVRRRDGTVRAFDAATLQEKSKVQVR
jgi:hypothetical protein